MGGKNEWSRLSYEIGGRKKTTLLFISDFNKLRVSGCIWNLSPFYKHTQIGEKCKRKKSINA